MVQVRDLFWKYPGADELTPVSGSKVNVRPGIRALWPTGFQRKMFRYFKSHLEAARADCRSNHTFEIDRLTSPVSNKRFGGFGRDLARRAPPPGMDGGNNLPDRIGDKDGYAIGCPDFEPQVPGGRNQRIAIAMVAGFSHRDGRVAVDLVEPGGSLLWRPGAVVPRAEAVMEPRVACQKPRLQRQNFEHIRRRR